MTVDFFTYCCNKDKDRLVESIDEHVKSHNYNFDNVHLIYQRCDVVGEIPEIVDKYHTISDEEADEILVRNRIDPVNHKADEYTHGSTGPHYWKWHCVNHLLALEKSEADYIVLSDADCHMKENSGWIEKGIELLQNDRSILVISPNEGSEGGKTQNMSQQLFLCERERLKNINFDLPFEGFRHGGPMQEYYFMLEGRIGRYMEKNGIYRFVLGNDNRYWHLQWH